MNAELVFLGILWKNSTGELHLSLLEELMDASINTSFDNEIDTTSYKIRKEDLINFQLDGAPSHYYTLVKQWLNNIVPDK